MLVFISFIHAYRHYQGISPIHVHTLWYLWYLLFVGIRSCFVFKHSSFLHDTTHCGGLHSLPFSLLWGIHWFLHNGCRPWGYHWFLHTSSLFIYFLSFGDEFCLSGFSLFLCLWEGTFVHEYLTWSHSQDPSFHLCIICIIIFPKLHLRGGVGVNRYFT